MTDLLRTFLTDREKLNGIAFHLIWSFGTYTEPTGLKKKKKKKKKQKSNMSQIFRK